jgi:hypothetical protein
MADSLYLLLCDTLWPKPSRDCLAQFDDSEPEPEQEPDIKPDPEPELKPEPESVFVDRSAPPPEPHPRSVYHAWLASRVSTCQNGGYVSAGAQRPLTRANLRLAQRIAELCVPQIFQIFWSRHPFRAFIMVAFSFVRGTFPVFKGYTHALIINEVRRMISSPLCCSHILRFFRFNVCCLPVTTHGPIWFASLGPSFCVLLQKKRWTHLRKFHLFPPTCGRAEI